VPIAEHYAARAAARDGLPVPRFSEPALVALRALVLSQGRVILPEHLAFEQPRSPDTSGPDLDALLALRFHEYEKLQNAKGSVRER